MIADQKLQAAAYLDLCFIKKLNTQPTALTPQESNFSLKLPPSWHGWNNRRQSDRQSDRQSWETTPTVLNTYGCLSYPAVAGKDSGELSV
jgi:hypothetical protein